MQLVRNCPDEFAIRQNSSGATVDGRCGNCNSSRRNCEFAIRPDEFDFFFRTRLITRPRPNSELSNVEKRDYKAPKVKRRHPREVSTIVHCTIDYWQMGDLFWRFLGESDGWRAVRSVRFFPFGIISQITQAYVRHIQLGTVALALATQRTEEIRNYSR